MKMSQVSLATRLRKDGRVERLSGDEEDWEERKGPATAGLFCFRGCFWFCDRILLCDST